tara:strand:- start:1876 stop:2118 length:243 start_codon:yes stop_codon:yes gene_type:complete
MKNLILVVFALMVFVFANNLNAQDCEDGKCKPVRRPVKKLVEKLNSKEVIKFEFKFEAKRNWKWLRPKNWISKWSDRGCK